VGQKHVLSRQRNIDVRITHVMEITFVDDGRVDLILVLHDSVVGDLVDHWRVLVVLWIDWRERETREKVSGQRLR